MFIPKLRFNHVHKHVNMANFDYFSDLFLARFTSLNHSITKYENQNRPKLDQNQASPTDLKLVLKCQFAYTNILTP